MKASYRWLRALLPGLELTPEQVAAALTKGGLQVEQITEFGAGTKDLVVARVVAVEPHPSRAKLRLVTVDRGLPAPQRIVCGAPNVPDPGGMVALAPLGATLPAVGVTLDAREIGGIVSEGMLCSERELGLASQQSKTDDPGILILPSDLTPGTPLRAAVPSVHDYIFEVSVTPNRPDALGHVGLARDLAAIVGLPFHAPSPDAPARVGTGDIREHVAVDVADVERCPHYGAAMVVDLTVGPSPAWLRYRLESLGIRSISNVVDVTNLILLEFGHPMHAFDLDEVRGKRISVRRAAQGEKLATLDGVDRVLDADDLVIADGEGPVALAGVMGGAGSEIGPKTKRVLLECAYFWPRGIRRTSRRQGLHTESSHRFERGVDPGAVPDVLAHAASLLTHLAGGTAVKGSIIAGAPLAVPRTIRLRASRLRSLIGADIGLTTAAGILTRLGFKVSGGGDGAESLDAEPPTHRPDITLEADVIEEVLRVHGLEKIPTRLPAIRPQASRNTGKLMARVRRAAIDVGLSEALTFGFCAPRELAALGAPEAAVTLKNPLTEERSVMRTSLLPGLLEALRRAKRHGVADTRLFALGSRFLARNATSPSGDARLPDEVPSFAAVLAGSRHVGLAKPEALDVYDAKGLVVEIVERALRRRASVRHQPAERRAAHLHPRAAAEVIVGGEIVGSFGPIHPDVADRLDLDGSCLILELDLRAMDRLGTALPRFAPIPTLPAATRDIALVVRDAVTAGEVADAIREAGAELCESVELFDLFRGGSIPEHHRSLAYHVVYRDPKASTDPERARTLTDDEVDQKHKAVVSTVNERFGATLRG